MRKSLAVVAAALTMVAAASFVPQGAQATPLSPAAGLAVAADAAVIATPAYGACWRVWRCGPFGCGFRSVCGWRPGPYYRSWAYSPYRPYGYYRRHWGW